MRLDRQISISLVGPLRRILPAPARRPIPVLMYHSISDDPETSVADYFKVCTTPSRFAEHLEILANHGFQAITLSQALCVHQSNDPEIVAKRHVVITFDDGYLDNLTAALPLLKKHHFRATLYVATALMGEGSQRRQFKNRPCLTWDELRELQAEGVEIGSHTVNHPKLVDLDWPQIREELETSKQTLEKQLSTTIEAFAYPFAFPSARHDFVGKLKEYLQDAHYHSCVTTQVACSRATNDPFQIPRLPANQSDDPDLFSTKLFGGYDWIGRLQTLRKRL